MSSLVQRVTDLAAAVRDKLNDMAPRLVPGGGAAGQVLAKASATDYDAGWIDPPAGGGGGGGPLAGSGARVPVATDDATAGYSVGSTWTRTDTAERFFCTNAAAGAAKWVSAGVASAFGGYKANGRYYFMFPASSPLQGYAGVPPNATRFTMFVVRERCTIDALCVNVTGAVASSNFALALYANDPDKTMPTGMPLATSVSGSSAATGGVAVDLVTPTQLDPGLYWLGITSDAGWPTFMGPGRSDMGFVSMVGSDSLAYAVQSYTYLGWGGPGLASFGAWSDMTGASMGLTVGSFAVAAARFSSVP